MKITEAFDQYVENYMKIKGLASNNINHYGYCRNSLVKSLGNIEMEDLTIRDVAKWNADLIQGRSHNTVREYICELRLVLTYLKMHGVNSLNPEDVPLPRRTAVIPDYLNAEEVNQLIENAPTLRTKVIISLLYSSGIRLSELLSLKRGAIEDRQFTVVGKGGKIRLCFTDERTEALVAEYEASRTDDCPTLLVSCLGTPMTATNVQLAIKNAAKAAKITKNVHPHALRHSFATNFLKNNGNMRYLSAMLGHASLSTTAHYAHLEDSDLKMQYCKFHTI